MPKKKNRISHDSSNGNPDLNLDLDHFLSSLPGHSADPSHSSLDSSSCSTLSSSTGASSASSLDRLLVDIRNLDRRRELESIFGRKLVAQVEGERRTRGGKSSSIGAVFALAHARDSTSSPWPRFSKAGYQLVPSAVGSNSFCVVVDKEGNTVLELLAQAVQSFDPEALYSVFYQCPWQPHVLAQLSIVELMQNNVSRASDFLERALHSIHHHAESSWRWDGTCIVDPRSAENRIISRILAMYIQVLIREGCPFTALQYSRLAISCSAGVDLDGVFLLVDMPIVKLNAAKELEDLCSFRSYHQLPILPSLALARMAIDQEVKCADPSSRQALFRFPYLAVRIGEEIADQLSSESQKQLSRFTTLIDVVNTCSDVVIRLCDLSWNRIKSVWDMERVLLSWNNGLESMRDLNDEDIMGLHHSIRAVEDTTSDITFRIYDRLQIEGDTILSIDPIIPMEASNSSEQELVSLMEELHGMGSGNPNVQEQRNIILDFFRSILPS